MDITKEITDDFCECFATKEDCTGAMARIIAMDELPEGIRANDERVKQIIIWCKENAKPNNGGQL